MKTSLQLLARGHKQLRAGQKRNLRVLSRKEIRGQGGVGVSGQKVSGQEFQEFSDQTELALSSAP
jgi:hypothetical protein